MELYLVCGDFRQRINKNGESYGWAIAMYCTPEHLFGEKNVTAAYDEEPADSLKRLVDRVKEFFPGSTDQQIGRLLAYAADRKRLTRDCSSFG